MADILMAAKPIGFGRETDITCTRFMTYDDFCRDEALYRAYEQVLWQPGHFSTRGRHARIARQAAWVVTVYSIDAYVAFGLVVEVGSKWLLEYIMTDGASEGQGFASRMMRRLMYEAQKRSIEFVILNCDPNKADKKLPAFYGKFGLVQWQQCPTHPEQKNT